MRTTDFSETSQVVHFFTRGAGMVHLLAKGTKRPKSKSGGMIDLLSEGDLVFSTTGRDTLGTLIEFAETCVHTPLRKEAARLNAALYMIELIGEMLPEGDVHAEVFDLLHNALARLAQAGSPVAAVLAYFQFRLLGHVGLLGDLSACVSCGLALGAKDAGDGRNGAGSAGVYFSSTQGGLLCDACEGGVAEKYRLDADTLGGLKVLLDVSAGKKGVLPDSQAIAVNRLLCYHITHQLGKKPRMSRHAIR